MRRSRLSSVLVAAVLLCTRPTIGGSGASGASDEQIARGKLLFRIHCQNCHGEKGRGAGPLAKELSVRLTDLTTITRRNGGDFPGEKMRRIIDGRTQVRAHKMKEMPVWGLTFQQSGRDATRKDDVEAQIDDLVAYLKALQLPQDSQNVDQ